MPVPAPPPAAASAAGDLIPRLLAAEGAALQRALHDCLAAGSATVRDAALALVAEAERVMGADPRRMERLCLTARDLADRADDDYLRAMATMRHGDYFRVAGRNAEARDRYDEAAAVFTRLGRPVEAARTRIGWVWATAKLGRADDALQAARKARRVLVAHGEAYRAAVLEGSIALLQKERGDYWAALRSNTRALAIFRSLGKAHRLDMGRGYAGRALALTRVGRYAEAVRDYEAARDIYQSLGEAIGAARVMRNMGEANVEIGRYASALRSLEVARIVFRDAGLYSEAAQVAPVLAECYLYLNRPTETLSVLDEADEDLRRTDAVQVAFAVALRRVAAYLLQGERDQALAALDEATYRFTNGAPHHRAWLAVQRAMLILSKGDAAEAVALARDARALARTVGARRYEAAALLTEGAAHLDLGESDEAARVVASARRLARTLDAAPLLSRTHELLGRLAEASGKPAVARRHYIAAIAQLEREQQGVIFEFRESFAAERGTAYARLAALQFQSGHLVEALQTSERAKSRALADAISGVVELRPRGSAEARRLARELDRARGEYAAVAAAATRQEFASDREQERVRDRLAELEHGIVDLVRHLQLAADERDIPLYGAPAPALPSLPLGTALIEYFTSGNDILRFRLDDGGLRGDLLTGTLPEVARLLHALRLNLDMTSQARNDGARQPALVEQAQRILARLEERLLGGLDDLDAYNALVIVPHGILHYLPFHAFYDGARYLVERVAVSYAPSAALYSICRDRARRQENALILAHSAGAQLPHVLAEAEAVGTVLRTPVHRESAATRALLERAGHRAGLIHIAAHGLFRPDSPMFSAVQLADGPLTTADVFGLNLSGAFVTLSACETGRAIVGGGDELTGLARAFLYAGAAGLLVSQWRVDDASTAALMAGFYRALAGGAGRGEALRDAQSQFIGGAMPQNIHAHPFFWAGFQIVGGN